MIGGPSVFLLVRNMNPFLSADHEYFSEKISNLTLPDEELLNKEFEECEFVDCDFNQTIFRKCRFLDCSFTRCNLSVVKVPQSQFREVSFTECKVIGVDWTRASWSSIMFSASLKFHKSIINDSSFFGINLREIAIEECIAHDVDFRGGNFSGSNFRLTDFKDCLFSNTDLTGIDFTEATNYDIDVYSNKINNAKFDRYEAVRLLYSLGIELVD